MWASLVSDANHTGTPGGHEFLGPHTGWPPKYRPASFNSMAGDPVSPGLLKKRTFDDADNRTTRFARSAGIGLVTIGHPSSETRAPRTYELLCCHAAADTNWVCGPQIRQAIATTLRRPMLAIRIGSLSLHRRY